MVAEGKDINSSEQGAEVSRTECLYLAKPAHSLKLHLKLWFSKYCKLTSELLANI